MGPRALEARKADWLAKHAKKPEQKRLIDRVSHAPGRRPVDRIMVAAERGY